MSVLIVQEAGEEVNIRPDSVAGTKTRHITNTAITIRKPSQNLVLSPTRRMSPRYLLAEMKWYLSAKNTIDGIKPFSKIWESLCYPDGTINSNYGWCFKKKLGYDQIERAVETLKNNPQDRQVVLHIKTGTEVLPTKDIPCTLGMQLTVERGRLNAVVFMRSNDLWWGFPYDVAFFTDVQAFISHKIGLPVGEYVHIVGDLHLYEKDYTREELSPELLREEFDETVGRGVIYDDTPIGDIVVELPDVIDKILGEPNDNEVHGKLISKYSKGLGYLYELQQLPK